MNNGSMHGNSVAIGGRGGQFFHIDWQLASQSIANNSSTINWQARFRYDIADAQLDGGIASLSGTRWSNGGRVRNFGADFSTRSVTLASGSFTVGHNADGTHTLSVSGGVDVYGSGRSAGSQSFNLPTIPRNSQVTTNDSGGYSIGTPLTIYTNRKSSSFTHTITIRLENSSGAVLRTFNSVGSSVVWQPTTTEINTMQNAIPNDNRLRLHITQRNNQVRQDSVVGLWTYIRNATPTFSNFTYKDTNTATVAITGNDQVLVKGKSTLEVKVPSADKMVAIKGADENRYTFAYDGVSNQVSYSTSDITSSFSNIDTVGSRAILVTAYDSRSNNTRVAKNVQVYDYVVPNIEMAISRQNNFGDNVTIESGGTFDLLPIDGVNKNELTASSLKYRNREKGTTTWGSWVAISFTVTDDGFSGTDQFIALDNTKEFEFEFQIADKFGTVTQVAELGKGEPIMFVGHNDGEAAVSIGSMPVDGAALTILDKNFLEFVYPIGSIYTNKTNSTNPSELFGFGTWVAVQGRVIVGKAASGTFATAGATMGEETHELTASENGPHTHTVASNRNVLATGSGYSHTAGSGSWNFSSLTTGGNIINSSGSGTPHNNIQPSLVAYVWERTA